MSVMYNSPHCKYGVVLVAFGADLQPLLEAIRQGFLSSPTTWSDWNLVGITRCSNLTPEEHALIEEYRSYDKRFSEAFELALLLTTPQPVNKE